MTTWPASSPCPVKVRVMSPTRGGGGPQGRRLGWAGLGAAGRGGEGKGREGKGAGGKEGGEQWRRRGDGHGEGEGDGSRTGGQEAEKDSTGL
jgi:hypothetical protein